MLRILKLAARPIESNTIFYSAQSPQSEKVYAFHVACEHLKQPPTCTMASSANDTAPMQRVIRCARNSCLISRNNCCTIWWSTCICGKKRGSHSFSARCKMSMAPALPRSGPRPTCTGSLFHGLSQPLVTELTKVTCSHTKCWTILLSITDAGPWSLPQCLTNACMQDCSNPNSPDFLVHSSML
jgi:hypothetical protein